MRKSEKYKALGLGLEIWIILFAVIASIPLLNMFALPVIVLAFSTAVAVYIIREKRKIDSHKN